MSVDIHLQVAMIRSSSHAVVFAIRDSEVCPLFPLSGNVGLNMLRAVSRLGRSLLVSLEFSRSHRVCNIDGKFVDWYMVGTLASECSSIRPNSLTLNSSPYSRDDRDVVRLMGV